MSVSPRVANIFALAILAAVLGGTVLYAYDTRPCAQPIYYSLGTFDTRFGITKASFLEDAQAAANLWNAEAGHTVLAYEESGSMPVNLIFDSRQQQADTGVSLASQERALDLQRAAIKQREAQYDSAEQSYRADVAQGASPETLNAEARSLNELGAQIQADVDALNRQISSVNSNVDAYNAQTGTFEEGEYVQTSTSTAINLYEFKNTTQLKRLIAHEFGHALGLGHVENADSIMYPENQSTSFALSTEDKAALQARCAVTLANLDIFARGSSSMH